VSRLKRDARGAGTWPQRARYLPDAPRAGRVQVEAKPFSVGFRIEHPQSLIDQARASAKTPATRCSAPPITSWCITAANGRSVYSFCMCPGGTVVAATSEPNRVVTNGMSQYSRNERNANSRHRRRHHPGRLIRRRHRPAGRHVDLATRAGNRRAFEAGWRQITRHRRNCVGDFLCRHGRPPEFGAVVALLQAGRASSPIWRLCLPDYAISGDPRGACRHSASEIRRLRHARRSYSPAWKPAPRRRCASPVATSLPEPEYVKGLYPAGEGAGYAGGILVGRRWMASRSPRPWRSAWSRRPARRHSHSSSQRTQGSSAATARAAKAFSASRLPASRPLSQPAIGPCGWKFHSVGATMK
jgi:hypothetical protein